MHSASKESHGVFTDQHDFSTFLKKTVRPLELVKINSINCWHLWFFYVSFSLNTSFKAYGLRHTSGRIRHLWKKDLFWTWLDPGSYPSLCFIPPLRYTLDECVTCLGKRDPLAPASKKDFHPWCSPESSSHLVKATWGFSCVFAPIVLILVSLCLLLFRDPLFHADVIDSFDQRSGKNVGW